MRVISPKTIKRTPRKGTSQQVTRRHGYIVSDLQKDFFTGSLDELITRLKCHTVQHEIVDYIVGNCKVLKGSNNTFAGGLNLLKNGCPEIMDKYLAAKKTVIEQPIKPIQQYIPDTEGLYFDVATYLTGQPECWINNFEEELPAKIENVYINIAAPSTIVDSQFFKKLIHIIDHIDRLERNNTRCNVFIYKGGVGLYDNGEQPVTGGTMLVQIKQANEPVNLQQLCTLVASPIMLRFAWFVLSAEINHENYGSMYTPENEDLKLFEGVYIPSMYYDGYNGISSYNKPLNEIYQHIK